MKSARFDQKRTALIVNPSAQTKKASMTGSFARCSSRRGVDLGGEEVAADDGDDDDDEEEGAEVGGDAAVAFAECDEEVDVDGTDSVGPSAALPPVFFLPVSVATEPLTEDVTRETTVVAASVTLCAKGASLAGRSTAIGSSTVLLRATRTASAYRSQNRSRKPGRKNLTNARSLSTRLKMRLRTLVTTPSCVRAFE
jgi:hypothetical protein